jgi:hypothetical protein
VGGEKRVNDGDGDVYNIAELGSTSQKAFINPVTLFHSRLLLPLPLGLAVLV